MAETKVINGWEYVKVPGGWQRSRQVGGPPADPTFETKGPKAKADLVGANLGNQKTAQEIELERRAAELKAQEFILARQKFNAELAAKGQKVGENGSIVQMTPEERVAAMSAEDRGRVGRLNSLTGQINRTQELDNAGPGSTSGLASVLDYLPLEANTRFNTAGNSLAQQGLAAFRTPGTGTVSDRDAIMFDRANLPSSGSFDATNDEIMRGMRARVDEEYRTLGLPTPQWTPGLAQQEEERRKLAAMRGSIGGGSTPLDQTPWNQNSIDPTKPSSGFLMAPATRQEYDYEAAAIADQIYRETGSMEEVGKAMAARGLTGKLQPPSAAVIAENKRNPKYGYFAPPLKQVQNSAWERVSGGGPAASVAGYANGATFGAVEAFNPQLMAGMRDAHPVFSSAGEVLGAIKNGGVVGRMGTAAAAKYAPKLLGGGKAASVARQVANDATYGAVRGGLVDGDPLSGAGLGAVGSITGQAVGNALGRTLTGVTSSPTIARLRAKGVNPTPGEIARARANDNGGRSFVAAVEDTLANNQWASMGINARRADSLNQANIGAFNTVSGGAPITRSGMEGVDQLIDAKTAAYNDALRGVSLPINDPRFRQQINAAGAVGKASDMSRGKNDFGYVMDHELRPLVSGGEIMGGRQLQDAIRVLQKNERAFTRAANSPNPDPAAIGAAKGFKGVNDAFIGLAARHAPQAVPKLKKANAVNRGLSVLDDAAERASANDGVFTGPQLMASIKKNNGMFGSRGYSKVTKSPLFQDANDMTNALSNKIPPTGVNNVMPLLAAAAGGAGYAGGELTDNSNVSTASAGLGLLGLLAAGAYTKGGNNLTAKALLDRPEWLRELGKATREDKKAIAARLGLSLPFLLGN